MTPVITAAGCQKTEGVNRVKTSPSILLTLVIVVFTPNISAQALSVFGGDSRAKACFDNAEYAAKNMPIISRSMLEPCNYALEFGTLSLKDRAATYSNRGIILAANERIESAMSDYEKAISISPGTPEIYVNRGNAYFMDRNFVMALDDYDHSVALGIRELHIVRYNMGMALENIGNLSEAEQQFISALELQPGWELVEDRLVRLREKMRED